MKSILGNRAFIAAASLVIVISIWEFFGRDGNPILTSYPSAVFESFLQLTESGDLPRALLQSIGSLALGYGFAALVGVPIGLILGRFRTAEAAAGYYFLGFDATPLVAFLPLYILWFGLGTAVKVAVVFTFAVTPIVINTWIGVRDVPRVLTEVGKAFCASEPFILRRIVLPAALPAIVSGLRLGVGRAIIALAVAELFTAITGLGGMLLKKSEAYDTAGVLVCAFTFMALGILMTTLLDRLQRKIAPWHYAASAAKPVE